MDSPHVKRGVRATCPEFSGSLGGFIAKVAFTLLDGSGAPRPGGTVILTATEDAGLPYSFGSFLGTVPIKIDTRMLDLSVAGSWPAEPPGTTRDAKIPTKKIQVCS